MTSSNKFNKTAVDDAAKQYFKLLWKDYGEDLVRDIPRRIKAALHANKKVAVVDESATVFPVAHAKTDDGLAIEGVYKSASSSLMFHATLDKDLNIKDIKSFGLR